MGAGVGPVFGDAARAGDGPPDPASLQVPLSRRPVRRRAPAAELPASYLHRPRVDALLDALTRRRVTLVVAPAGSGKTVAVAGWAHARRPQLDVRWVDLDPGSAGRLTAVRSGSAPSSRTVLVLDDAHLDPEAGSRLLDELFDADTEGPPLVVLSRHEPDWIPMALRLSGQVAGLGYAELRFRADEARALVRSQRPEVSDRQLEPTVARARGWAAGLVLMAQSLAPVDTPLLSASAAPRPVLDYVASEVLADLSAELRQVLTAVCHEPSVVPEQAAILSGLPDAAELLVDAASGEFLVESGETEHDDDAAPSWRIHPLLVEVLRRRTAPDGPDRAVAVDAHRRAAEQLGRAGDALAALRHAIQSGVLSLQLAALRKYGVELLARGDGQAVARALDQIPTAIRGSLVQTLALDALVLRGLGRYDDAKRAADAALTSLDDLAEQPSRPVASRDIDADLAILDVWEARCGWRPATAARALAAQTLGCDHDGGTVPVLDHSHDTRGISPLRSAWLMLDLAALELWSDDADSAAHHVAAAEAYSRESDFTRQWCSALSLRATLQMAQGSYQTAAHTADTCLRVLAEHGLDGFSATSRAHLVRGFGRFHALDLDGAAEDLEAAETHVRDPFTPMSPIYRRILEANLLTAAGKAPAARQLLAEVDNIAGLPGFAVRHLSVARMRAAGWMADVPGVETEVSVLRDAGFEVEASYAHGLALGLSGEVADAIALYDRVLLADEPATSSHPLGGLTAPTAGAMAIGRVAFLLRTGTPDAVNRARHLLPDALNRLAPQRLLWLAATGLMISPRFAELLEFEASRVGGHPLAETAAAALRRQPRNYLTVASATATPVAHEAAAALGLTPRELDVLHALSVGGSNATIAAALFLSENTVKTHLAALYRKLGVDSRSDATATARRVGLL